MSPLDAKYPSLAGQVVLVTGGASGIGAAHVAHFAAQGARVAFLDRDSEAAGALGADLRARGLADPLFVACDLRDIAALRSAVAAVRTALGPIGVLVNNAAHDERHAWQDVTVEYWEDRLQVNLRHQFFAIQAVAPDMLAAGGGSIINFGSISWRLGQGGMPAYTTAKAGIEGLTRSFARDLGPANIRVNCVIPGWIMTARQLALWVTPEAKAATLNAQCLKQMLVPDDVARLVLWLAASDSRMCTGQSWVVDGGRL
ncbi:MAG: SDR family oxidoreductase [Rhodospirillales bacterium]|nr:SDR family oxidoreductase [Rhodospirillales bacterium]MDE2198743.1 SDR family oxidoreductase [Rhodospirillales bacterium]MDE2575679.1 SDR family oxidoreductase [Rhodospirillales bacterium]